MIAEILCVGTELLLGQVLNTDAQYLSRRLSELGIELYRIETVGDNPGRVREAVRAALGRCDLLITTGGLGPTEDDLTKEMVAEELDVYKRQARDIAQTMLTDSYREFIKASYEEGVRTCRGAGALGALTSWHLYKLLDVWGCLLYTSRCV